MKLQLIAMAWLWVIVIPASAQKKITFDLRRVDDYQSFIDQMRDVLKQKDPKTRKDITCHGLPVLARDDTAREKFVLVELKVNDQKSILLPIELKTIYTAGYSDEFKGKCRSFIFKDVVNPVREGAVSTLCNGKKGATTVDIPYTRNYGDVENNAGGKRKDVPMGIDLLKEHIDAIHGKEIKKETQVKVTQAKFVLTVAQVVSEAVRFQYIAEQVKRAARSKKPEDRLSVENEWDKISGAIAEANINGEFKKGPLKDLMNENGTPRTVRKVQEIKGDIGLLNYFPKCVAKKTKFLPYQILLSYYTTDNLMGGLEGVWN